MDAENKAVVQLFYNGFNIIETFSATLDQVEICNGLDTWKTARITLNDRLGKLELFLAEIQTAYPIPVVFRYGFSSGGTSSLTPAETWLITEYRTSKNMVVIDLVDTFYWLTAMRRFSARSGTISGIIESITSTIENERNVRIISRVEKTLVSNQMYYQSNVTDWDFIKDRMLPRAVNADGCANYHAINRFGMWVFANLDYSYVSHQLVNTSVNNVLKANRINKELSLASGYDVIGYDPLKGELVSVSGDREKVLRRGQLVPKLDATFSTSTALSLSHNGENEISALAQHEYAKASDKLYTAQFNLANSVLVCAGDAVTVPLNAAGEANITWNGLWSVLEVRHVVHKGVLETSVKVTRGDQAKVYSSTPETNAGKKFRQSTLS